MPTPRKHANPAQRQRAYMERQRAAKLVAAKSMPAGAVVATMPSTARWKALTHQAQTILLTLLSEMEAYRDERSEAWKDSEKCEAFQEIVDQVEDARDSAQNIGL